MGLLSRRVRNLKISYDSAVLEPFVLCEEYARGGKLERSMGDKFVDAVEDEQVI